MMDNIFSSTPISGGHSWTIVSRLGHIIRSAENKYGKRDLEYTILGVELTSNPQPQIWFPGNCKHIAIQITNDCINNMDKAIFQVAHEVIHCFSPNQFGTATYLEEGLATYFSLEYLKENGLSNILINAVKYELAYSLVKELLSENPAIIKQLREIEPNLSKISKGMLIGLFRVPEPLAEKLTTNFSCTIDNPQKK